VWRRSRSGGRVTARKRWCRGESDAVRRMRLAGDVCTLSWWTRLPASGEYKHRLKRQDAMAKRFWLLFPWRPHRRVYIYIYIQSIHIHTIITIFAIYIAMFSIASFSSRLRRLSQLPPLDSKKVSKHGRSHSSLEIPGVGLDRHARLAVESFNPWSPHQTNLRNFAVMHGGHLIASRTRPCYQQEGSLMCSCEPLSQRVARHDPYFL
jgi:hypothetical protein